MVVVLLDLGLALVVVPEQRVVDQEPLVEVLALDRPVVILMTNARIIKPLLIAMLAVQQEQVAALQLFAIPHSLVFV